MLDPLKEYTEFRQDSFRALNSSRALEILKNPGLLGSMADLNRRDGAQDLRIWNKRNNPYREFLK